MKHTPARPHYNTGQPWQCGAITALMAKQTQYTTQQGNKGETQMCNTKHYLATEALTDKGCDVA